MCSILQTGLAYCVAGPATSAVPVPSNAVPGAAPGCKQWFDETNLLCFEIAAQFGITVAQVCAVRRRSFILTPDPSYSLKRGMERESVMCCKLAQRTVSLVRRLIMRPQHSALHSFYLLTSG